DRFLGIVGFRGRWVRAPPGWGNKEAAGIARGPAAGGRRGSGGQGYSGQKSSTSTASSGASAGSFVEMIRRWPSSGSSFQIERAVDGATRTHAGPTTSTTSSSSLNRRRPLKTK